jgi:hypothetical protein
VIDPKINIPQLEKILGTVPKNTPWFYVLYAYITTVMKANNGNRTRSSKQLKMPLRSLKYKFPAMEVLGFEIPPYRPNKKDAA